MKSVYLAGPISTLNWDEATSWRDHATDELRKGGIAALSPMRCKDYLRNIGGTFSATCDREGDINPMSLPRGIMTRDRYDATHCDVLLVNLLGATTVSVGTVMEIAWADSVRTPIVCAMEYLGNPHEHAMVEQALGYRVDNLDEAIAIVKAILGAYA